MAFDGAFLRHVKTEIESIALNSRIEKIYQPNSEEFIFSLRSRGGVHKLLISSRANSSRIHFTSHIPENPDIPPMLCMLFRKKLHSARLINVRQPELERVLFLDFEVINELGDKTVNTVVCEIMGKYSNVILINNKGIIVDALKRVDFDMSRKRQIMPGMKYNLPPKQLKLNILKNNSGEIIEKISSDYSTENLSKAFLDCMQGISPIVCGTLSKKVALNDESFSALNLRQIDKLKGELDDLCKTIRECHGRPFMVMRNKPLDFTFINIKQISDDCLIKEYSSFSELLDDFYTQKDTIDRMRVKSQNLNRTVASILSRLKRKVKAQNEEIACGKDKENYKTLGDLINANIYSIEKGAKEIVVENFFEESLPKIKIKLDPSKSAAINAQKYYKDYKKAKTAQQVLKKEIIKANDEIKYIESIQDAINRAETETELSEIKKELVNQGYIKDKKKTKVKDKKLLPIEYVLENDYRVLVGRNNIQNDKLTTKIANKNDLWFHVKDMPGSHTILISNGKNVSDELIKNVATIAAFYSRARESSNVAVDYTIIKNVKKPNGAKPGMVVYDNYKTIFVTPNNEFIDNLINNI